MKDINLKDYESIRTKNFKSDIIVDILSLSAGLDMAINAIKEGEITKKAREALTDIISKSYLLFTYRVALQILKEESLVDEDISVTDILIVFDTPDDTHDDLIIYYKIK